MKKKTGRYGESIATQYLQTLQHEIIDTNWRVAYGEIDIVALQNDTLIFVEVKTRQATAHTPPEQAVDSRKQERLLKLAQLYLAESHIPHAAWRIDVVAIRLTPAHKVVRIDHYIDAVQAGWS